MYEVGAQGQTAAKAKQTRSHPLLCVDWSADGQQVLSGGTDGLAKIWNLGSNQEITIGQHQGAIKSDKRQHALTPAVAALHGRCSDQSLTLLSLCALGSFHSAQVDPFCQGDECRCDRQF